MRFTFHTTCRGLFLVAAALLLLCSHSSFARAWPQDDALQVPEPAPGEYRLNVTELIKWKCPPLGSDAPPRVNGIRQYLHIKDSNGRDFQVRCDDSRYLFSVSFPNGRETYVDSCEYPGGGGTYVNNEVTLHVARPDDAAIAEQARDTATRERTRGQQAAAAEQPILEQARENARAYRREAERSRNAGDEDAALRAEASALRADEMAAQSLAVIRRADESAERAEGEAREAEGRVDADPVSISTSAGGGVVVDLHGDIQDYFHSNKSETHYRFPVSFAWGKGHHHHYNYDSGFLIRSTLDLEKEGARYYWQVEDTDNVGFIDPVDPPESVEAESQSFRSRFLPDFSNFCSFGGVASQPAQTAAITFDTSVYCSYGGGSKPIPTAGPPGPPLGGPPGPPSPGGSGAPQPGSDQPGSGDPAALMPQVAAGSVLNVGGASFAPNSKVTLRFVPANGDPVTVATVPTDGDGAFVTSVNIPGDSERSGTVVAEDGSGNSDEAAIVVTNREDDEEGETNAAPPPQPAREESTDPKLPVFANVKATRTVMEGAHTAPVKGAMIRLDLVATPELPVGGNRRDDSGHDQAPIQGVTLADGSVNLNGTTLDAVWVRFKAALTAEAAALSAATGSASGRPLIRVATPLTTEVDLTPQSSTNVLVTVDPSLNDWGQAASYLHSDLVPYLTRQMLTNGTMVAVLTYPQERTAAIEALISLSKNVAHVETNFCRTKQEGEPDPYFLSKSSWGEDYDDQWAIKRVGFTADADSTWSLVGAEADQVVVAVIDSGLDWNHQDLSWASIWTNEDEIPDNGIDDDNNGYTDDAIGWDFVDNTNSPWDRDGHGTFVAGVIAAAKDNGIGIAGINPHAKIMALKALNSFGHTRASFVAEALLYAANNGARVINLSVGGKNLTRTEQLAIDHARSKGAVIIVSAGNEGMEVEEFGPAGSKDVITVASTDFDDKRAAFSNWGPGVDLAAPGIDVLSLRARRTDLLLDIPGVEYEAGDAFVGEDRRYYRAGGTSFSAPIVAGVASLILSRSPDLTNEEVERMLLHSAGDIETPGVDSYTGYGLLDSRAALEAMPSFFAEARILGVEVVQEAGATLVRVSGIADADRFSKAWIEIGQGTEPTNWKRVADELTEPVHDGALGAIPADEFRGSSEWTVRLLVEHEGGMKRQAWFTLNIG